MEIKKKLSIGALAATISIASLSLISSGCKTMGASSSEAKSCGGEKKSCGGEKKCGAEKQCGAEKKCGGEKAAEKSCGGAK